MYAPPAGSRGRSTHSSTKAAIGIASAPAYACDRDNAASNGSSLNASTRMPFLTAADGVCNTTAIARSSAASLRRSSGVVSSSSRTSNPRPLLFASDEIRSATALPTGLKPKPTGPSESRLEFRASATAPSISASARRARLSRAAPASVNSTRRVVRTNNVAPSSRSRSRIARDKGDCDMCSRSAARPKCNSSATATK